MANSYTPLLQLLISLLLGLIIGSERGWHERESDEGHRIAGLRTFILIASLGGVAAMLCQQLPQAWPLLGLIFIGLCALLIAAHLSSAARDHDQGVTTVVAALLVFWLAVMPHFSLALEASILAVIVALLLHYKRDIHHGLAHLQALEIKGMLQFLVVTLVLLPLLPRNAIDPWQTLIPYKVGWLVVLIAGLGMVGYFATRWLSTRYGLLITSFVGGMVSSTAVTLTLARMQKTLQAPMMLSSAILLACGMMYLRLSIIIALLAPSLFSHVVPALLISATLLLIWASVLWHRNTCPIGHIELPLRNPFELISALQFALLLSVIMLISTWVSTQLGETALYPLAMLSGVSDVDAISLSLLEQYQRGLNHTISSWGILLAASTNTLVKGFLSLGVAGSAVGKHTLAAIVSSILLGLLWRLT